MMCFIYSFYFLKYLSDTHLPGSILTAKVHVEQTQVPALPSVPVVTEVNAERGRAHCGHGGCSGGRAGSTWPAPCCRGEPAPSNGVTGDVPSGTMAAGPRWLLIPVGPGVGRVSCVAAGARVLADHRSQSLSCGPWHPSQLWLQDNMIVALPPEGWAET